MSERRENAVKLRVGVFVILALLTFLGLIYALGARARLCESRYTIHAEFTEVGGLLEGATVRLAGVQIGRVTAVTLPGQPGGKVRVDLTIAKRFSDRIRKNSVARIETQGLLGDKIVEITVGDASAPPVAPGEMLVSRDPADFSRIIASGAETAKNVAELAISLRETADKVNQSKIIVQTAWICCKASKIDCPDARSVNAMPMPKIAANTSMRTLSFDDNEANMLVGMRAKMPKSRRLTSRYAAR